MNQKSEKNKKKVRIIPIILITIVIIIAAFTIDSNVRLVTTEYELYFSTLPDSFDGFRIVLLADLHDTEFGRGNEHLISRVRDAEPDIIVIAGDILNSYRFSRSFQKQLESIETLISNLASIAPIYFVQGNHEGSFSNMEAGTLLQLLRNYGAHVLLNDYVVFENNTDQIIIVGINWRSVAGVGRRESRLIENIYDSYGDSFIITIAHSNSYLSFFSESDVDLILSGHGHGGLIRLPFTDGLIGHDFDWFPTYTSGVYSMDDTYMLVSRGLGSPPLIPRFLNNPHIAVAVLRGE